MKLLAAIPLLGLVLATGCNTPKHSNVLIFATNTKFAIDIGYDPKMQEPSLTVGYKRQEGVWMPLLANTGKEGLEPGPVKVEGTGVPGTAALTADGLLYRGNEGNNKDTYSVLASFGAKYSASGSTKAEASGGLAQFFATGLAARELATRENSASLFSVQAGESQGFNATSLKDPARIKDAASLDELIKKPLSKEVTVKDKTFKGSETSAYADALARDKGHTLATIRRYGGEDLKDIVKKLQEATK